MAAVESVHNGSQKESNGTNLISDDEAAIYDRQIRLWGVEAQKKIRSCSVLMIGLSGLGSEIVKNLVLAGIASISVWDDTEVTASDTLSNLFTGQVIGQNRALIAESEIKQLNPMVEVTCKNLGSKDITSSEQFQPFNVVILNNVSRSEATRLNNLVRSLETPKLFYYTGSFGMYAFSFIDLGKTHSFVTEENIDQSEQVLDSGSASKSVNCEKKLVNKTLNYCSLETSLAVKCGKSGIGLTKRTSPLIILVHTLLEFRERQGRFPSDPADDGSILTSIATEVVDKLGLAESLLEKLNSESWQDFIYGELSPVASIGGGVVAQDIIRGVSEKDATMRNFFLFSGVSCNGLVESIGKWRSLWKKRPFVSRFTCWCGSIKVLKDSRPLQNFPHSHHLTVLQSFS